MNLQSFDAVTLAILHIMCIIVTHESLSGVISVACLDITYKQRDMHTVI